MGSDHGPAVLPASDRLFRHEVAVELGAVVALLLGFSAYTVGLSAALDPYFLDSDTSLLLVGNTLVLTGAGVLATAAAAWRGYPLPVSLPDRADGWHVAAAVAGTGLLATVPFALLAMRTGTGLDHVVATLADPGGVFSTRTLIRLSLFVPGMAILYHGLVQGSLRHAFGDARGLAAVGTTLLGGYLAAPTVTIYGSFGNGPWLSILGRRAAVVFLFVLAVGVAAAADRRTENDRLRALARLPVLAALVLAVLVLTAAVDSPGGALVVATRTAVIGVAAAAFDATDSLIVPALVYATFAAVSSVLYVSTLAAAFGG